MREDFETDAFYTPPPGVYEALSATLDALYGRANPMPTGAGPDSLVIPETGIGAGRVGELWAAVAAQSTALASPWMMGHMDTAAHPIAALTDAVVSGANGNMLFRELSPFASRIEEAMIAELATRLGLPADTPGIFTSGGSIANLTGLFAAVGGYADVGDRTSVQLFIPETAHTSVTKAASILGIPATCLVKIPCDDGARMDPSALEGAMEKAPAAGPRIVVAVLGTTVTGGVDDIAAIGRIAKTHGAWFHVDAVYGAALAYSVEHRAYLSGIGQADSISLGPQKWLYVPRVSALTLFPGLADFDARLGVRMPYSQGDAPHRGTWGLQGSRRADAVTLWVLLTVLGSKRLGSLVDDAIALTQGFHKRLQGHPSFEPVHMPDLNLQVFRAGEPDPDGQRLLSVQAEMVRRGRVWFSVSRWRDESVLRAVLLNANMTDDRLDAAIEAAAEAVEAVSSR